MDLGDCSSIRPGHKVSGKAAKIDARRGPVTWSKTANCRSDEAIYRQDRHEKLEGIESLDSEKLGSRYLQANYLTIVGLFPNQGHVDFSPSPPLSFAPVSMKDAQCAESNEKSISRPLFFDL